jgi:hypothetical protein
MSHGRVRLSVVAVLDSGLVLVYSLGANSLQIKKKPKPLLVTLCFMLGIHIEVRLTGLTDRTAEPYSYIAVAPS